MIAIVQEEGLSRPQVFCDHCGQQITEAADGNYVWTPVDPPGATVYFTHKRCDLAFRVASEGPPYSGELKAFPVFLARNPRSGLGR